MERENQLKSCLTSPLAGSCGRRKGEGNIKKNLSLFPLIGFECVRTQNHFPRQGGSHTTKAFTLIELLVVVLIIGILAAVTLPQYQQAVLKSRVMQVLPYLKAVKNAEEAYYLANGKYTSDMDSLSVDGTAPNGWAFYLMENETETVKAKYQDGPDLHIVTSFDHRTDYPEWAGITYCYAITALHKNVCKSMGALIPNGEVVGGARYYIAN